MKASAKLKQLEEENEDAMFVIVSDVWLDNIEVMEKLNLMFSGVCFCIFWGFGFTHQKSAINVTQTILDLYVSPRRLCLHASHLFHFLW